MNPLTNVKNITKLNKTELALNIPQKASWHNVYKDSAWIFIGGLDYELSEGDIICVFSQYGEIVNVNLIRDKKTGKSKGYCFLCYEDQKSTVLAVDNLNGIKLTGRIIRVDHVADYKPPKDHSDDDDEIRRVKLEGVAPRPVKVSDHKSDGESFKETKKQRRHHRSSSSGSHSSRSRSRSQDRRRSRKEKRRESGKSRHGRREYPSRSKDGSRRHSSRK